MTEPTGPLYEVPQVEVEPIEIPPMPLGATFEQKLEHRRHWVGKIVEDMQAHARPFDSEGLEQTARGMLERTRDPELQSSLWDYREGKISARELMRVPAFRRERDRWYAEIRASQG